MTINFSINKKDVWAPPDASESAAPEYTPYFDAFSPNESGFEINKIVDIKKEDETIFLAVQIPNESEIRWIDVNLMRVMCPIEVARFLSDKYLF